MLTPVPAAWRTRKVDFGRGPRTVVSIPWGDVSTAYHSTGIPNIEVYTTATWPLLLAMKASRLFGLLDGRWGNKLDNSTESFRCINPFLHCAGLNLTTASLSDQAAAIASAFYNLETGYFQDAGFVKLREVSLTYFAPAAWASRIGASSLNLTLTGRNLATWTNYKGADPELNTIGQFNFSVADFLTQPPVRYFLARVNVTF